MYVLLTSKDYNLPTVVSEKSSEYVDLKMSGKYIEEDTGTKREMEDKAEEILQGLYGGVQRD